jgi:CRISPR-associated protein Cmr1
MRSLIATFRIVTPMFISGADQDKAQLRIPSIKGALRFWWRALAYSRLHGDLVKIHEEEAGIFGSTESASPIRMSASRIDGLKSKPTGKRYDDFVRPDRPGARYLAYGVMNAFGRHAGELIRPCLEHAQTFHVHFLSRHEVAPSFLDALKLFGLLGGVGSRARRGYGSLTLERVRDGQDDELYRHPPDKGGYKDQLSELLNSAMATNDKQEPPYSAFSCFARIDLMDSGDDPIGVLDTLGRQMQRYRSWGHDHKVNGEPSEKNFRDDHRWCKGHHSNPNFHPRRAIFGLPHNYTGQARETVKPLSSDRRASPLFLHIHRLDTEYVALATTLRARFLPKDKEGAAISAANNPVPANPQWDVIYTYLEGKEKVSGKLYFPQREPWFRGACDD